MLAPIANHYEIQERQKIISFLVEHEDVLQYFQQQLSELKKYEKSLFSYWDKQDQLSKSCEQFYYAFPGLKHHLNKSNLALNVGVATQMALACKSLLMSLCLDGVYHEMLKWTMIDQQDFNFMRGLKQGLSQPLRQHSFALDLLKGRENDQYTGKDIFNIDINGTLGDRYHIYSHGYKLDGFLGLSSEASVSKAIGFTQKGLAFLGASTHTVIYDYFWGTNLLSVLQQIVFMHMSLKQLTERIKDVSSCFNAMAHVVEAMQVHTNIFGAYGEFDASHDAAMKMLKNISKKQQSHKLLYQYSRGHVLTLHKEIKQIKTAFIPLLQKIALLDAFCSIAQLYKEHEQKDNRFCFVTFVDAHTPHIAYENAWLALLPHNAAVANDLYVGNKHAGKMVITGPNGGGKSTILKTYGVAAVLAQSWGIVPATRAEQTILHGIKTGLSPHEDLQLGLSTFMAEKKCMEQLNLSIKRTHKANKILVLIDEPYKGTVDDESAKRIYNFGLNIATNPYALVCIATHVKKPIFLADATNGAFANYHVEIREKSVGEFERLFTLQQGPATWWFENEEQRGRFVDWISVLLESQEKNKQYEDILLGKRRDIY